MAIHAHVLPTGKVLFWSRREWLAGKPAGDGSLDPHDCQPRIWDPGMGTGAGAFSQTLNTPGHNLFCSGHTFLPDGRLFVVGGHIGDGEGETHTTIYDPNTNTWTRTEETSGGRWYPTAVTLPDGSVLVSFGSKNPPSDLNDTQQVWKGGHFRTIVNFNAPPLYPRMHVVPDGRVFMSGPNTLTQFLDTNGAGNWTFLKPGDFNGSLRSNQPQDYAPSVMYDEGKILYVGGGNPPSSAAQVLNLKDSPPTWRATGSMSFARRQHNATILPDGTVLVTGGTKGSGGPPENPGFNDLTPGQPVHVAELWDPNTGRWTPLAAEDVDRCYHSTAVLLPDARVLSAGGGEYRPDNKNANDLKDSHRDAQIFRPPYFFRGGTRPVITSAPTVVTYQQTFPVGTSHPNQVGQVNWVRLSSVTHAFNQNQRINFLRFTGGATSLSVTAPDNANLCPPGHYMLFVLDRNKVPSVAKIISIH